MSVRCWRAVDSNAAGDSMGADAQLVEASARIAELEAEVAELKRNSQGPVPSTSLSRHYVKTTGVGNETELCALSRPPGGHPGRPPDR